MEPLTTGIVFIIVMLVLLLLSEMPIAFAMGLAGAMGIYAMGGKLELAHLVSFAPYSTMSSFMFMAVPMFVLMGFFVAESGIAGDIFIGVKKWLGWLSGGLAMAISVACAALGTVIGGAMIEAIMGVTIGLPEMRKAGYKDILSLGMITSGGTLGALIPPSVPLIIYGVMTETSVAHLFIAGIVPGILTMLLFCVMAWIWCKIDPRAGPAVPRVPFREMIRLPSGVYITVLIAIVCLGGIYAGFATPTEGGALGAFIALVFGVVTRRLGWGGFVKAIREMVKTTGMILMLLIGAMIFSDMLSISGVPFVLVDVLTALPVPPLFILIIVLMIYLILGFFLPILPMLLILMPVLTPVFDAFGFDRIWIGVLTILTMLMGQLTPPVGILVFAVSGIVKDVPMWTIFKGVMPFVAMMLLALVLIIIFPDIAIGLVKMMKPWAY